MFSLNHNWGDDSSSSHIDLQLLGGVSDRKAKKKRGKKNKNLAKVAISRPSTSQQSLSKTPEVNLPDDSNNVKSRSIAQTIRHRTTVDSGKRNVNKFKQRLQAGRFRWVNEKLYTIKGLDAFQMFKNDPNLFHIYHTGFQEQVDKWPLNPLDNIIDLIKNRSKDLVIADLGCGEGRLAQSVPNKVYSIDLASKNDHVIACDMAHTPLEESSVDMVVFCLALMGTNLLDYMKEANRILKSKGILLIAEVCSRIENENNFIRSLGLFGFKLKEKLTLSKMFIRFELVKSTDKLKKKSIEGADIAALKPCIYKKR